MDDLHKLAFNFIPNIGAVSVKNLISYCGGMEQVFSASKKTLMAVPGIGEFRANEILKANPLKKAEEELELIKGKDIRIIFYLDPDFPVRLKRYEDSPILLYARGNMNLEKKRMVAIVGTRKITNYGRLQCEKLVDDLKQYDCSIISGLAHGVDTTAHRRSLEVNMETIGVLGNGLSVMYPAVNRDLARRMLDCGGLLSEYPMATKPDRENFPRRNRVIAAMADVVIIVESARSGGSMITAEYANNYNKDVFAIPGRSNDEMSEGCNLLIKSHRAHLCDGAHDIGYIMRWDKQESHQMELVLDLPDDEQQLMDLIKEYPNIGLDTIHYRTKIPLAKLTTTLLNLEFKGLVKPLPGKKFILAR